jgi:hypothetical protein
LIPKETVDCSRTVIHVLEADHIDLIILGRRGTPACSFLQQEPAEVCVGNARLPDSSIQIVGGRLVGFPPNEPAVLMGFSTFSS